MKITLAGPAWPYRGGIADFSNRLARQFSEEGHETDIVTFSLQYPGFLFPGKTQYTDSPPPDGIRIRRMINSVNPLNWINTGSILKEEKPDILLLRFWLPFMGPSLGTLAKRVKSNGHTKALCIFDNVIPHEERPGDRQFTKYFVRQIDGAIVMAGAVGEDLDNFRTGIPVKINPHPLFDNYGKEMPKDEALKVLNLPADNKYILFFGFIRAYKGLDLLIQAFADNRLREKGIKLIVAGEFYEDPVPYNELIAKHGLEKDIILFSHFIKDEDVASFFSIADLIVQPYRSATQSGVTQVAYHFGKPMLVTDVGGLKEIVPHGRCGYVVDPEPRSIAGAISDFFTNDRGNCFSECVRKEKEKFTWDRMTGTILECYREINQV